MSFFRRCRAVVVGSVVSLAGLGLVAPSPASAATGPVPANQAIAVNVRDGSSTADTSFVVHQIHLHADGSATVVTDPDVRGGGREAVRPARQDRTGRSNRSPLAVSVEAGVDPDEARKVAEQAVDDLLAGWAPEAASGLFLPNVAVAYSGCDDCRTLAAAVEVVLISGVPRPLVATNIAVSINDDCTRCVSGAYAYQLILVTEEQVELDRPTLAAIAQARRSVDQLGSSKQSMERVMDSLAGVTEKLKTKIVRRVT